MKVNMDGLRQNLTLDANKLGEWLKDFISVPNYEPYKYETVEAFNSLAQAINILNCITSNADDSFNELPETIKVSLLSEEE